MEVQVNKTLSKKMRDTLRSLLTRNDLIEIEIEAGCCWMTMTNLIKDNRPKPTTKKSINSVIIMLKKAMFNKNRLVEKRISEVTDLQLEIKYKRADVRDLNKLNTEIFNLTIKNV